MRKLTTLIFSLILAFTLQINHAQAASFQDLDGVSWAEEAIDYLSNQDIIHGYSSTRFGPKDPVTRAQATLMLVHALYPDRTSAGEPGFTDVPADYFYYDAIALASEKGLVQGYDDHSFRPEGSLTRAEAAVLIDNAYQIDRGSRNLGFSDATSMKWAVESILDLSSQGIINGYPDGLFKPDNTITRAEFSVVLAAALNPDLIKQQNNSSVFLNHQLNEFEQKVVELTNDEREKHGLNRLAVDPALSRVARYKSRDMSINNYFSHDSPTYGSPFEMMDSFSVSYRSAGENIAAGYASPERVVEGWMKSPGHRANILKEGYTHIGIGYEESGSYRHYWTQMFNRK